MEDKPVIIGIDIDEVALGIIDPFLEFHNHAFGTRLARADITNYQLLEIIGCSPEELRRRFDTFNRANLLLLKPMPGAPEVIRQLTRTYRLVAISSRPLDIEQETLQSLEQNFPGAFSGLYLTGQNFDLKNRHERTKGTLCRDIGVRYMVEDSLEHAREIRGTSPGTRVLLYDYGGLHTWNQLKPGESLPVGVERAHTWGEIIQRMS